YPARDRAERYPIRTAAVAPIAHSRAPGTATSTRLQIESWLPPRGLVPKPFDLLLSALGRACPAPTPRPCRGEACLARAPHATRGRGGNHDRGPIASAP